MLLSVEKSETSTTLKQFPDVHIEAFRQRSPRSPLAEVAVHPGDSHAQ
jgi:hypothetical protein